MASMGAGVAGSYLGYMLQRAFVGKAEGERKLKRTHTRVARRMRDEMQSQQGALVAQVLAHGSGTPEQRVASWVNRDDPGLRFTLSMFGDMRNQRSMDYPTVSVALRRLAQLAAAGAPRV